MVLACRETRRNETRVGGRSGIGGIGVGEAGGITKNELRGAAGIYHFCQLPALATIKHAPCSTRTKLYLESSPHIATLFNLSLLPPYFLSCPLTSRTRLVTSISCRPAEILTSQIWLLGKTLWQYLMCLLRANRAFRIFPLSCCGVIFLGSSFRCSTYFCLEVTYTSILKNLKCLTRN